MFDLALGNKTSQTWNDYGARNSTRSSDYCHGTRTNQNRKRACCLAFSFCQLAWLLLAGFAFATVAGSALACWFRLRLASWLRSSLLALLLLAGSAFAVLTYPGLSGIVQQNRIMPAYTALRFLLSQLWLLLCFAAAPLGGPTYSSTQRQGRICSHLAPHEGPRLEDLDLVAGLRQVHGRDHARQATPNDADLELLIVGELDLRTLARPVFISFIYL